MTIHGLDSLKHIPSIIVSILNFMLIGFVFYRVYKEKEIKPKLWKALGVMYIGAFAFTFNFNFYQNIIQFPILPIGVWIIYWFSRRRKSERWTIYRGFAWKGFLLRFVFIITNFLIQPINSLMYPKDEIQTFIADIHEPSVLTTNIKFSDVSLISNKMLTSKNLFKANNINSEAWYYESSHYEEKKPTPPERFPYLLLGTKPKFGSGLDSMIYIEKDGKGIFITTNGRHYYFRSEAKIISPVKGGNSHVN
ncbi:hypothetical protein [Bacillus sp. EAC]|uniref:hypothetical protein n=1 Tax=Bacillus sp. EAC TaxID=1978338 RepID=UPI000B42D57C|nr:hypothetical protein [Bacillus sp. EAC]